MTSRMGGSTQTTFLGNYNTISTSATDLGNKVMDSFAAAIGNIVYDKSAAANDHDKQVFWGHGSVQLPVRQLCGDRVFLPVSAVYGRVDGRKMAAAPELLCWCSA